MNHETYVRLSGKGKRRAVIVWAIEGLIIGLGLMTAVHLAATVIHGYASFVAALVG